VHVCGNVDATQAHWSTRCERVRIVSNASARHWS
jgi:hypothetical protein